MSRNEILVSIAIGVILASMIAFAAVQPYFEAKAFNRLTGASVGYWDAVFVELRIDCDNYGL